MKFECILVYGQHGTVSVHYPGINGMYLATVYTFLESYQFVCFVHVFLIHQTWYNQKIYFKAIWLTYTCILCSYAFMLILFVGFYERAFFFKIFIVRGMYMVWSNVKKARNTLTINICLQAPLQSFLSCIVSFSNENNPHGQIAGGAP